MKMRGIAVVLTLLTSTMLLAKDQPSLATDVVPSSRASRVLSAGWTNEQRKFFAPTPSCGDCTSECAPTMKECAAGGQADCYLAAACLCQCNLNEGGCGSSKDALQQCVDDNKKKAADLGR